MSLREQFEEEEEITLPSQDEKHGYNEKTFHYWFQFAKWLEARDKEHLDKIEKMQQTISHQMDLIADATRELSTLKKKIEDAPRIVIGKEGFDNFVNGSADDPFALEPDEVSTKVALLEVEK